MERRRASVPRERYALAMRRRGTTVLAGLGIGIALAVALLLGVAAPEIAQAGMRKCEDHFLDADDDMRLRAAALKVLPKSVHLDEVGACWNPRNAYAWISTKKGTSIEGVQQWYEFPCSRKAQPWRCDPPEFKQLTTVSLRGGDITQHVTLSFDQQTSLERAKLLAVRALTIYADPTARLPSCLSDDSKDERSLTLHWQYRHPVESDPVHVSVSRNEKIDTASLDDVSVNIGFPVGPEETEVSSGPCWNEFVIVA
jgi:hypothetical protein